MKFDFHVHSQFSDGDYSLAELSVFAQKANLDGFALTDHDTVEGWRQIKDCEEKYHIQIIPAVEISTEWEDKDVHILAYGLTEESRDVLALLDRLRRSRIERVKKMVQKCSEQGYPLEEDAVFAIAGQGSPGRPHVAKALLEKGYVVTVKEAFAKFLNRNAPCYVPREKISPFTCVEMVGTDGGFPVLAHPGIDKSFRLVPQLKKYGLWGLEVYHSSHSPGEELRLKALAEKHNLKVFAGSDFHSFHQDNHGAIGSKYIEVKNLSEMFR